jgi:NAD dependent epimerase/dehydratase
MKVLLTGAGGFIPSHVCAQLLLAGHSVRALVHYNSRGSWGLLPEMLLAYNLPRSASSPPLAASSSAPFPEVVLGDVTDAFQMQRLVLDMDAVIHMAAHIGIPYSYQAPASFVSTNIVGTLNILEACRLAHIKKVIITSTSEVYGTAQYTPIDEAHPLQAQSPYAASKIAADKLAEAYYKSFDLPVLTLRPFNTYGPGQSARAIIPTVLCQALSGAKEIYLGNLAPRRDLTYVEDTARAFVLALSAPNIAGRTIHFGQELAISIADLAQRCLDVVGSQARIISTTERLRPEKSEVQLLLCNPALARETLGWQPLVNLDEGLKRTAAYIQNHLTDYQIKDYTV